MNLLEELVCFFELGGDEGSIIGVRCHTHQAGKADILVLLPSTALHEAKQLVGSEAVLRLFLSNMHLKKDGDDAPLTFRLLVNLLNQTLGIDGMDEADERCDVLDLVRLQVADEVPLNVLGQHLVLRNQFLHMALPEDALTAIVGFLNERGRMVLADSNKTDTLWQRLQDAIYSFFYHYYLPFLPLPRRGSG